MKLRRLTGAALGAVVLMLAAPTAAQASPTGTLTWSIPNAPADGFKQINFYLTVQGMDDQAGWYFAYQFKTLGGHGSYIGLQPKPRDASGNKGGGTWEGVVSDMATNQFLHIGQWTLNGSQLLAASHVAWAERYLDGHNCTLSQIPYFKVTYRSPIGWSSGGTQYNGTLSAAKEGGPCAGKQGFVASGSGSAVTVQAGS